MSRNDKSIVAETFFRLVPIQMILVAIGGINSIIDTTVASNLISATAVAAMGLFYPVAKLLDTVNTVFLGGSQILCGQFLGKNQVEKSSSVFSLDMTFITVFGALLTVAITVLTRPAAGLLAGADQSLVDDLCAYMRGYAPGIIPGLLVPQLTSFLQMEHQETRTYIGLGSMVVSNTILDVVFVRVLHLGMFGLGLATTVAVILFALIMLLYYARHNATVRFSPKSIRFGYLKHIIRIGSPGAVGNLCQTVRSIVLNSILMACTGTVGMAAFSTVYSFGSIFCSVALGIASAVRMLGSIYTGEEDRTGLVTLMKTALIRGTLIVAAFSALLSALCGVFASLFYRPGTGELYELTRIGFMLFPLAMPFSSICCTFSNYYQCTGRMKKLNILAVIDGVLGVLLFSILLVPTAGIPGVWIAHILSGLATVLFSLFSAWKFHHAFPDTVEKAMMLSPEFGVSESDRIDLTVTDMAEVINLSEKVVVFAKNHGIEPKRAMYSGLCVEEMAGNIVLHGFNDRKAHRIDVRVVYRDNGLLIRLKDDCRSFNPKEFQDLFLPEDITRNIGLRLISGMAVEMSYQNTFGLNALTIRV